MQLASYSPQSLSDLAVLFIKDNILSGKIKSGDKIIENEICTELSISRAPLREALRRLNEQGLVTFSPRKCNQVIELNRNDVLEIFELRLTLELQISDIIIRNDSLSTHDLEILFKKVENMSVSTNHLQEHERVYLLNTQDLDFHRYIWNLSNSTYRAIYLENLYIQLLIAMNVNLSSLGIVSEKAAEHLKILEALKTKDIKKISKEFKNHIKSYIISIFTDITTEEMDNIERRVDFFNF